jgi:uncharacterized protein
MSIFWIIVSYLLGSIPTGYIIGKLSGKNVLEVGWKKTSGSNVYKNVGKKQGILTGVLDVTKGFLAVWLAQKLGFSFLVQMISGAAAVMGHNWSCFLKFSGGRGIATLIGAFLALFPSIILWFLVPALLMSFIWNASIGTLLFFFIAFCWADAFFVWPTVGFFSLLCFIVVLIKRLSPIKEIGQVKGVKEKLRLARNRLIFDNNEFLKEFRIAKYLKKENKSKTALAVKIISAPVILPTKASWQILKFSAKMAKKPIDLILKSQEKNITEIGVEDLKKIMVAAAQKIVIHQEEINNLNVFPVADKDTGYNFAATLLGIESLVSQKKYDTLRQLAEDIKEAAMINARGNAGMIFTGYLIEVLERIKHLEKIDAFQLSFAMRSGIRASRNAVVKPIEGTVLDVIAAAGNKAFEVARQKDKNNPKAKKNIISVLEEAHLAAQLALKETPEKLAVLKQNDVVDAGGFGFVKILEAWIENLKGQSPAPKIEAESPILQSGAEENLQFRYEVVMSFKKSPETTVEKIQADLSPIGDSLEVIEMEDCIKLHIHTNEPQAVVDKYKDFPEFEQQTEDMSGQTPSQPRKPLGLVVGQTADLPKEFLEQNGIEEVQFKVGQDKKGRQFTSAPSFKEYLSVYKRTFEKFEKFLVITISSKLSGTYSSARIARSIYKKPDKLNIYVFDCFLAEVGEGLVGHYAQNLIDQGKTLEEVVEDLKVFCPKISLFGCVDNLKYLVSGGRLHLPEFLVWPASFMQKIGVRLLIGMKKGSVKVLGVNLGNDSVKILADKIDEERKGQNVVVALAHCDNEKKIKELEAELQKRNGIKILFISPTSPVMTAHLGSGALIVAFYPLK